ncbi:MAG: spore coat protein [Ruminococcus sp.]|nr:spore coat protein [Ruminococcus sp.]
MNDQQLMENMLLLEKGVCDLYLHGTIEAYSDDVRGSFATALNSSLSMQDEIYSKMSERGWYKNDQAEQDKVSQMKQQFS